MDELSNEKCILAQRLIDLITRTRARLDADIVKVKYLQGETPDSTSVLGKVVSSAALGLDFGPSGRNPAQQISESLRNALVNTSESRQGSATPVASAVTASSGGSATKSNRFDILSSTLR
jgi:chromatin modification-related protein YNG2